MRIFTIAPDGSDEREIVPATLAAQCCVLAWSPDGGRLAFLGERRETASLDWVDTYDSSNHKRETIPDYEVRRQSLYTVKADGSGLVELAWSENPNAAPKTRFGINELRTPEEWVSSFQWSPDGKRVVFVARQYGEKDGIYVADAEGASVQRIFDLATMSDFKKPLEDERIIPEIYFRHERISEITWSPDGSRIEFETHVVRGETNVPGVYSVSADGSDMRQVFQKEPGERMKLSERIKIGSGPKRILRYDERYNANAAPEVKEWILTTAPWGSSQETVLVKIVNNRLTAVDPIASECSKAIPQARITTRTTREWTTTRTTRERRTGGLMQDCRTLLDIKNALAYEIAAGDPLFNWTGSLQISNWNGITVEDGRVLALEYTLGGTWRKGTGTIPPKIADLTELRTLDIRRKELEGEIPPELGGLSKLEILRIGGYWDGKDAAARVAGRIPPELGSLANLRILDLSGGELEGEIPPELGNLSNLEELDLSHNELEGEIPRELGEIPSLVYVDLSGNDRLTGCVLLKQGVDWDFYADLPLCE